MDEELFNRVKTLIVKKIQNQGTKMYIEHDSCFLGVKAKSSDRYYWCFVTLYPQKVLFSFRENCLKREVKRIIATNENIEELSYIIENIIAVNQSLYAVEPEINESRRCAGVNCNATEFQDTHILVDNTNGNLPGASLVYRNANLRAIPYHVSARILNCLNRNNIFTVEEFLSLGDEDLLKIRQFGNSSLTEARILRKKLLNPDLNEKYSEDVRNTRLPISAEPIVKDLLNVLNISHYNFNFTENDMERYIEFNNSLEEIFDSILNEISKGPNGVRNTEIYRKRIGLIPMEQCTLQHIGADYNLSRERIRQIIIKIRRRVKKYQGRLISKLNELPENDIMNFFVDGTVSTYASYIYQEIFILIEKFEYVEAIKKSCNEIFLKLRRMGNMKSAENKIYSKINFPAELRTITNEDFGQFVQERIISESNYSRIGKYELKDGSCAVDYESYLERRIISILDGAYYVSQIKTQSMIIPYERNGVIHEFFPDIIVHTADNHMIIIEVKTLYEMGTTFSLAKYDGMKEYCEKNGYGYVMIDERYNTIESLSACNISEGIENDFIDFLKCHSYVNYQMTKAFFASHDMGMEFHTLMKILIMQRNNVVYSVRPFCIRYVQ